MSTPFCMSAANCNWAVSIALAHWSFVGTGDARVGVDTIWIGKTNLYLIEILDLVANLRIVFTIRNNVLKASGPKKGFMAGTKDPIAIIKLIQSVFDCQGFFCSDCGYSSVMLIPLYSTTTSRRCFVSFYCFHIFLLADTSKEIFKRTRP